MALLLSHKLVTGFLLFLAGEWQIELCFRRLVMRPTPIILGLLLVAAAGVYLGLLLGLAGDWRWVEGWIFGGWFVSFAAVVLFWLYYRDPALLTERFRMPGTGGESRADVALL